MDTTIGSAEELLEQTEFAWGTINSAHPKLLLEVQLCYDLQ